MARRLALVVAYVTLAAAVAGCTDRPIGDPKQPESTTPAASPSSPSSPATTSPSVSPSAAPPARFDAARALRTVRHLAVGIGPRLATGPAFREAADRVAAEFAGLGYAVRRPSFPVPAGDSWGVAVRTGRSSNVIATPGDFDPAAPYVVIGAHLDTVAVAPGAEDNASGVAVLLEVARVLGGRGQVVLVAFGGEEPRGPGELHHFGSKRYVAALSPGEARHLRAMVSLDRVGVGSVVPISSVEGTPSVLRDRLARLAERADIPTVIETDAASDHESFADAGFVAARLGSTPYSGYHSAEDLPHAVEPAQLRRVGRLVLAWLREPPAS